MPSEAPEFPDLIDPSLVSDAAVEESSLRRRWFSVSTRFGRV